MSWREGSHQSSQLNGELLKKNVYTGFSTAVQGKLLDLLACGLHQPSISFFVYSWSTVRVLAVATGAKMAVRQAPTSVVQNVISALVEDPAELKKTPAAASAAAISAGPEAIDAVDAIDPFADSQAAAQLHADELLKQAEEQAGDQVRLVGSMLLRGAGSISICSLSLRCSCSLGCMSLTVSRTFGQ